MGAIGFTLFNHFIAYYGLMIVIGILLNIPLAYVQVRRFQLVMNDLIIICSFSALLGVIGAKILYFITIWKYIDFSRLNDLSYISPLMSGGFVFIGGVFGFLLAIFLCEKILHIPIQPYIQACTGCLPIGHAFGRIGCFLVGCCYGKPYTGIFAVTYTKSLFAPQGIPLFPVQIAEALIEFLLGICLLIFSRKLWGYSALLIYLLVYSSARFLLEFLRHDEIRGRIGVISTSQLLSIVLIIFSLFCLIRHLINAKNSNA